MLVENFVDSFLLLYVLLNPFLMSVYLLDLLQNLEPRVFCRVLVRASLISSVAFVLFALAGDAIFSRVLQARFEAFLIFGGIIFLLVAIRYVMVGTQAISGLRGPPEHLAGSVAMPFMIGPGTVSASVLAGSRLPAVWAALAVLLASLLAAVSLVALKWIYDHVRQRQEALVERYVEIVGRISALMIGTIAIDMVLRGIDQWLESLLS